MITSIWLLLLKVVCGWDEIYSKTLIKATSIEKNYLINVIINEFDENFDLINTIQSEKIDINEEEWIIDKPIITKIILQKKTMVF